MYFSQEAIHRALSDLENIQPFYGITFLVCKQNNLPIGEPISFPISQKETAFLNAYYKPILETAYYFRVFRPSDKSKFWLEPNYSSTGSQSNRTQKFGPAFIHPKGTDLWGWHPNYIRTLKENLQNGVPIPGLSLAIWIFKDVQWDLKDRHVKNVFERFIKDFNLLNQDLDLFELGIPIEYMGNNLWAEEKYNWKVLRSFFSIPSPHDAPAERITALQSLEIENIGPAEEFSLIFNKRLNLITGDNGLGKTFILESIWWALTDSWTGDPLYPNVNNNRINSTISYTTEGENGTSEYQSAYYNRTTSNWQKINASSERSLVVYAKADGLYAVMDPNISISSLSDRDGRALVFTKKDIWDGLADDSLNAYNLKLRRGFSNYLCNGLISDWVNWQQSNDVSFEILKKVLKRLSPPKASDLGTIEPGNIVRVPNDSRLIPTIKHPYGEVPVIHASEGVKRILSMAYLIAWTWQEHKVNSANRNKTVAENMIFMSDEIEVHLHPQWQRSILPALLDVSKDLDKDLSIQFIVTSHSPIVLGSIENLFNEQKDKLFHLDIDNERVVSKNVQVEINEIDFQKRGTIDSWLTSEIFNLDQPRGSIKAEEIIEKAINLQLNKNATKDQVEKVTDELRRYLPAHDRFWVRWRSFADRYNIDI